MTMPPMGYDEGYDESALSMTIQDVFHIKGRGTVVTGRLQGNGELDVGDVMLCDGRRWQVRGIERFGAVLTSAQPGSNIGVLIADDRAADMLRGCMVQFAPGTPSAGSQDQFRVLAPKKKRWRN